MFLTSKLLMHARDNYKIDGIRKTNVNAYFHLYDCGIYC